MATAQRRMQTLLFPLLDFSEPHRAWMAPTIAVTQEKDASNDGAIRTPVALIVRQIRIGLRERGDPKFLLRVYDQTRDARVLDTLQRLGALRFVCSDWRRERCRGIATKAAQAGVGSGEFATTGPGVCLFLVVIVGQAFLPNASAA